MKIKRRRRKAKVNSAHQNDGLSRAAKLKARQSRPAVRGNERFSMELKVVCQCGQKFKFDVEPVNGQMPFAVTCPVCNQDGTATANAMLAGIQANPPPPLVTAAPPPLPPMVTSSGGLRLNRVRRPKRKNQQQHPGPPFGEPLLCRNRFPPPNASWNGMGMSGAPCRLVCWPLAVPSAAVVLVWHGHATGRSFRR